MSSLPPVIDAASFGLEIIDFETDSGRNFDFYRSILGYLLPVTTPYDDLSDYQVLPTASDVSHFTDLEGKTRNHLVSGYVVFSDIPRLTVVKTFTVFMVLDLDNLNDPDNNTSLYACYELGETSEILAINLLSALSTKKLQLPNNIRDFILLLRQITKRHADAEIGSWTQQR